MNKKLGYFLKKMKTSKSKKPNKIRTYMVTNHRLTIIFGVVLSLFAILVVRLAYMQLINSSFYLSKLDTASTVKVTQSSVRGLIYDATGTPLVENQTKQMVSFTRSNTMTSSDLKDIATKLKDMVTLTNISVSDRDKIDYYLSDTDTYAEVVDSLPDDERYDTDGNSLDETTIYNNAVASVDVTTLNYSEEDLKIVYLFTQLNSASNFQTITIDTDTLTATQIATISSNSSNLEGISIKTNWTRNVLSTSLASIIGTVSTESSGLPAEMADYYLGLGYSLNDRVGTSYLEQQYEEYLQGTREETEINLDRNGNVENKTVVTEGKKGDNIKLTIDLNFQDGVNSILQSYFNSELAAGNMNYSEGVYAVVLNPNTGAVLAMAGYDNDNGTLTENALGTITHVFVPGSVVKPATLTAGWKTGAITGNQTLTDQSINIGGSVINSWFTAYGSMNITAIQALEYSSNTYMVQVALKMLGQEYTSGMEVDTTNLKKEMSVLRKVFGEYGLGVETGIDLPFESTGYVTDDYDSANYLTDAFGQFDNYTPMQLAQFSATLANGGTRIAPHLVEGIYGNSEDGGLGNLIQSIDTEKLNTVDIDSSNMDILHQGMYQVVNGVTGYTTGTNIAYGAAVTIAAKTGTAETYAVSDSGDVVSTINTNVIAYAPYNNPQIAVAVVLPHVSDLNSNTSHYITRDIINLYNSLYPMSN